MLLLIENNDLALLPTKVVTCQRAQFSYYSRVTPACQAPPDQGNESTSSSASRQCLLTIEESIPFVKNYLSLEIMTLVFSHGFVIKVNFSCYVITFFNCYVITHPPEECYNITFF